MFLFPKGTTENKTVPYYRRHVIKVQYFSDDIIYMGLL